MSSPPGTGLRGGFTMTELLIVSAILVSLAAFSWPSLNRSFSRTEHQRVAADVQELLQEARRRAIESGHPQLVRVLGDRMELQLFEIHFDQMPAQAFAQPQSRSDRPRNDRRSDVIVHQSTSAAGDQNDLTSTDSELVDASDFALLGSTELALPEPYRVVQANRLLRDQEQLLGTSEIGFDLPTASGTDQNNPVPTDELGVPQFRSGNAAPLGYHFHRRRLH